MATDVSAQCDGEGNFECFCAGDYCECGLDGMPCFGCIACCAELQLDSRESELQDQAEAQFCGGI